MKFLDDGCTQGNNGCRSGRLFLELLGKLPERLHQRFPPPINGGGFLSGFACATAVRVDQPRTFPSKPNDYFRVWTDDLYIASFQ
jgi:hypothetical protein